MFCKPAPLSRPPSDAAGPWRAGDTKLGPPGPPVRRARTGPSSHHRDPLWLGLPRTFGDLVAFQPGQQVANGEHARPRGGSSEGVAQACPTTMEPRCLHPPANLQPRAYRRRRRRRRRCLLLLKPAAAAGSWARANSLEINWGRAMARGLATANTRLFSTATTPVWPRLDFDSRRNGMVATYRSAWASAATAPHPNEGAPPVFPPPV